MNTNELQSLDEALCFLNEKSSNSKSKTYDKVKWHVDNGEDKDKVIRRFKFIFIFLSGKKLLNQEGEEEYKNIGEDTIISSSMLTNVGINFLDKYYDDIILGSPSDMRKCWDEFPKVKVSKKQLQDLFDKFADLYIKELAKSLNGSIYKVNVDRKNCQIVVEHQDRYSYDLVNKYGDTLVNITKKCESKISSSSIYNGIIVGDDFIHNDSAYCVYLEIID